MIFIDLLKDEHIEELSDFIYKLRNNILCQNKFDSNIAKNRSSIFKSMKKRIQEKNHFVIYEEDKLIGYLVLDFVDSELIINEIYFDKINNSILFKVFRFLMDYAVSNLFDIIKFKFKGFIFDEIIKEHLDNQNRLEIRNDIFEEFRKKFAIVSFKSKDGLIKFLQECSYDIIYSFNSNKLDKKVCDHVDMQIRKINENIFVCSKESYNHYRAYLPNYITLYVTEFDISDKYPKDCLLNNFSIKNHLICNKKSIDPVILKLLKDEKIIMVNQGYSKCSTIVTNHFVITSDKSIFNSVQKEQIEAFLIDSGEIKLEGYDTGFIGGTCGYSSDLGLVFYGNLEKYKYKEKLIDILNKEKIKYYYPKDDDFIDRGSIIFN